MHSRLTILAIVAVFAGALVLGAALPMQAQGDKTQQQQSPTQQSEFSQSQLESFASAALKVQAIRTKWRSQVQEAGSTEKAQELQAQAGAEMVQAVEEKGLTVETYNAIAVAARSNPVLADRIGELMKQSR
jgi:hypothetical protein